MSKQVRFWEIDLLRIIFAIYIMGFHMSALGNNLFIHGHIGVEFFFLISGYYMVKHVEKVPKNVNISLETWKYLLKKIKTFYPFYIIAFCINVIVKVIYEKWNLKTIIAKLIRSLPELTCIDMVIKLPNELYLTGSWYLSAMIVAMFLMYPILLRFRKTASSIIFPCCGLGIIGSMLLQYGHITEVGAGMGGGVFRAGILRAIAEIGIGCFLYDLSKSLKVHFDHIKAPQKILCILLKIGAFLLIFLYVIGWLEQYNIIDVHIFLVLFIEILLIFCVPFRGATSFDMSILADISLFVYVTHGILIYIMGYHVAVKTNSIFWGLCVLELMVSFIFVLGYRRLSLIKKL